MPTAAIPPSDIPAFEAAAVLDPIRGLAQTASDMAQSYSRVAALFNSHPHSGDAAAAAADPDPNARITTAAIQCTSLDTILSLTLSPLLTLFRGEEACIQQIAINLQDGSSWPSLWIGAVGHERLPPSLSETVQILRRIFRRVGKDIVGCDVPNVFFVSDKLAASSTRWPEGLPQPPDSSVIFKAGAFGMDVVSSIVGRPMADKIEDVGWDMLERFAKVTTFAKTKTSQALEHPLARPFLPYVPEQIRSVLLSSPEAETLINDYDSAGRYIERFAHDIQRRMTLRDIHGDFFAPAAPVMIEHDQSRSFEVIRVPYVAHFSGLPLTIEEWKSWECSEETDLLKFKAMFYARIFSGGIEPSVRSEAWQFLLKSHTFDSKLDQRNTLSRNRREQYFNLKMSWMKAISEVADGGNLLAWDNGTEADKPVVVGDENENSDPLSKVRERKYRIEKDVVRTDRNVPYYEESLESSELFAGLPVGPNLMRLRDVLMTYAIYNFDLGYVQGMSDLCAPILEVMDDEVEAFWAFSGLMEMMKSHFSRDQLGMQLELRRLELLLKLVDPPLYRHMEKTDSVNMFCCFRWLLICFKREFPFGDIKSLWEVIWACPLTGHFHLFVAAAILNMNRAEMFYRQAFDEILKFINGLTDDIPVPDSVQRGEILFYLAHDLFAKYAPSELAVHLPVLPSISRMLEGRSDWHVDESIDAVSATPKQLEIAALMESWSDDMEAITFEEWTEILQLFVAPTL
ncbi:hypothetical protein BASA81_012051 [Batrachochytrium salamandrivorans]|nr:hypothetical protein BASA81_012051 [Batrachochytrium salamandrivorans]